MPPKAKAAPASTSALCNICPPQDLHPSTTTMSCPHGEWTFNPDPPPTPAQEQLSDLLDNLTAEQLQALLDAKMVVEPVKADAAKPAKAATPPVVK